MTACKIWSTELYVVSDRPVFYNRQAPILSEQELLDFWFKPEEEKEDWIYKAYNDFISLLNN